MYPKSQATSNKMEHKLKMPLSGLVLHVLSHGVVHFLAIVIFENHQIEASYY